MSITFLSLTLKVPSNYLLAMHFETIWTLQQSLEVTQMTLLAKCDGLPLALEVTGKFLGTSKKS